MNVITASLPVLAQEQPPPSGAGNMFMILILMMVMMYFLIIRPQKKQRRELEQRIAALKTGDKVVTAGGIHGMVANIKDRTVILKMHDNSKIEVEKASIANTLTKEGPDKTAAQPVEAEPVDQKEGR